MFKAWRKSPALTQETTPSQRRITRMLSEAQQTAAAEFDTQLPRVAELLSRGRVNEVTNLLPMDPWVDVQEPLAYELLGELLDAGSRVRLPVLQKAQLVYSFDRDRPESAAWAWNEAGQLIVQITQEQRGVVQQVVSQAATGSPGWQGTMTGGPDWTGVARQVRNTIGLTAQQAGWVSNHYDRAYTTAIRNGASSAQAAALASQSASRYQTSVHRYRANTIARTETMRAASEGRQQSWTQGMTQGFIDPLWQKEWIAEGDACPMCQAIDGKRIGVKDSFPVGEPPAHPNCRCDVLLVPPKPQGSTPGSALQDLGTGFDLGQFFGGPPSLSTPAPDRPDPTFIGMPSGVFIGMPRVVTFASILDSADDLENAAGDWRNSLNGDPLLGQIYKARGYDALPTIVDTDAFDDLLTNGARALYRGVEGDDALTYLEDFRYGDYFPGRGMAGNGTYTAENLNVAFNYSGKGLDTIMRLKLDDYANVITDDDLLREWIAFTNSPAYEALSEAGKHIVDDMGRYAAAKGYDAIRVVRGGDGRDYVVVLNRGRVTVDRANRLGPGIVSDGELAEDYYAFLNSQAFQDLDRADMLRYSNPYGAFARERGYRGVVKPDGTIMMFD